MIKLEGTTLWWGTWPDNLFLR